MKKYSSKVNAFLLHFMTLWLALGLALVLPVRARSTLHWIELENGKRVWMSEQEVFDFAVSRSGKNADLTFRDVTDEYLDRTEQKKMKVPSSIQKCDSLIFKLNIIT